MSKRVITLGTWNGNPIEWIVLKEDDFSALVISKQILLNCLFNNNQSDGDRWETSRIRNYLNYTFYNQAFNENEKKRIVNVYLHDPNGTKDNVFCLSESEANQYMTTAERCSTNTWWLRSPHSGREARNVGQNGSIASNGWVDSNYGVRPAVYVKE